MRLSSISLFDLFCVDMETQNCLSKMHISSKQQFRSYNHQKSIYKGKVNKRLGQAPFDLDSNEDERLLLRRRFRPRPRPEDSEEDEPESLSEPDEEESEFESESEFELEPEELDLALPRTLSASVVLSDTKNYSPLPPF